MSWRRAVLYLLLSLLVIVGGGLLFLLSVYEDVPVEPAWELAGTTDVPAGAVTVRFTGTSTMLFSDGETD